MSQLLEDEFALFENEIASIKTETNDANVAEDNEKLKNGSSNIVELLSSAAVIEAKPVSGPVMPPESEMNGYKGTPAPFSVLPPKIRPGPLNFLPHNVLRPGFMPTLGLGMRLMPPQLRFPPLPDFMRPPLSVPQLVVLESGPNLYESKPTSKRKEKDINKDHEASSSTMKTQVLSSDIELLANKRHAEAANKANYLARAMRGEHKVKRFLRSCGGQVWEDKSLTDWDPNDFRIFCGDLGNEVSDELLAKAFRKYPSFQKAKVIRESRTNKSKGYGFVSFKHQDDFVRACREMDGKYVGNRPIKLRKSNWKERNLDTVRKKQKQKKKLGMA